IPFHMQLGVAKARVFLYPGYSYIWRRKLRKWKIRYTASVTSFYNTVLAIIDSYIVGIVTNRRHLRVLTDEPLPSRMIISCPVIVQSRPVILPPSVLEGIATGRPTHCRLPERFVKERLSGWLSTPVNQEVR